MANPVNARKALGAPKMYTCKVVPICRSVPEDMVPLVDKFIAMNRWRFMNDESKEELRLTAQGLIEAVKETP